MIVKTLQDTRKQSARVIRSRYKSGKNHAVKLVGAKPRRG